MSPSRRSESASQSSPERGHATDAATKAATDAAADEAPERTAGDAVEIELEPQRQRPLGWTLFGIVAGALLVWKLGTVAQWGGVVLVVIGLFRAWELVQSFRNPPGTFRITDREVVLPRGLHLGKPLSVAPGDVTAVYFLRKSVPWNRASPVLVVELGRHAIAYPRDWFASEADQRNVVMALLAGRASDGRGETPAVVRDDERRTLVVELGGGGVLLAIGLVLELAGVANVIALGPLTAGVVLAWRAVSRRV
jgi:hypothetical protein